MDLFLSARRVTAERARYQQMFDDNPLAAFIYNPSTLEVREANQEACAKYGYSQEEFLKLTVRDLIHAEDQAAFDNHLLNRTDGPLGGICQPND